MGNSPLRDYDRLIEITVLGKTFQVPENNTCLRAFQFTFLQQGQHFMVINHVTP